MRNTLKFIGFAAIAAMLTALAFTTCNQPTDGPSGSVAVTGVTLNKTSMTLAVGGTETLTATIAPTNASNKNVSWTSSNTSVATVTNGTVNALANGTAIITVTTADGGKTATCTVTVGTTPGGNSGKLTVNNLPNSGTYAVCVFASGTDISTTTAISAALNPDNNKIQAAGEIPSNNVFNLYSADGTNAWTASGSFPVLLINTDGSATGTANPIFRWATVTFASGNGSADFSSFTAVEGGGDIVIPEIGGKLTIDGLPSGGTYTYAVYIFASDTDITTYQAISTALTSFSYQAVGAIISGSNGFTLVVFNGTPTTTAWKGTGNFPVLLMNASGSLTDATKPIYSQATINFTEGTGAVNFSSFTAVVMGGGGANQDPTANDFNIGNLSQTVGSVTKVTITPKDGKSTGTITIYYNGSTTLPTTSGNYTVTFDVGTATGWNAKSGLSAGTLTIADYIATSVADLGTWLASKPANDANTAYTVLLNVSDLGNISNTLKANNTTYVNLDLSGSAITIIPDSAFYGCTSLTSVTIPDSVTEIGDLAFSGSGLTSITIPASVTSFGRDAFKQTAWFNNQPEGVVYINKIAYGYNGTMPVNTSITLLDGTKGIANYAFYNQSNLTSVTIPNSVTSIGDNAFTKSGLTSVIIPNGVTRIVGVFQLCSSLTSVTLPNSVTEIDYAFDGCTSLTSVTIPDSVTKIGDLAFSGSGLTSITIPASVTSIERMAFASCTSLTSVRFERAGTTIVSGSFIDYSNSISLPAAYTAGGIGTYTRPNTTSTTWTKISS